MPTDPREMPLETVHAMTLVSAFRPLGADGDLCAAQFVLKANCLMMAQIVSVV
jgi:hypothetical protein